MLILKKKNSNYVNKHSNKINNQCIPSLKMFPQHQLTDSPSNTQACELRMQMFVLQLENKKRKIKTDPRQGSVSSSGRAGCV